jgi:hypothetical protein
MLWRGVTAIDDNDNDGKIIQLLYIEADWDGLRRNL